MSVITVKVMRVPGATQEVALDSGATVGDALSAASMNVASGESVKLNGAATDLSSTLSDGDRIIIAKGAKGNA